MGWISVIVKALLIFVKGIWGTDKPAETIVDHPEPETENDDGKTDKKRLEDLGL